MGWGALRDVGWGVRCGLRGGDAPYDVGWFGWGGGGANAGLEDGAVLVLQKTRTV